MTGTRKTTMHFRPPPMLFVAAMNNVASDVVDPSHGDNVKSHDGFLDPSRVKIQVVVFIYLFK